MHKNLDEALRGPVHFSTLKQMGRSPAHYAHAVKNYSHSTLAMRLGSGAHALLFGEPYVVYVNEESEAAGKKTVRTGKAWEAFAAEHAGFTIVNKKEDESAQGMVAAIKGHRRAYELLAKQKDAIVEKTIRWNWLGRECEGTPDVSAAALVDLKTGNNTQPDKFVRDGMWRGYHAQIAWYSRGLEENYRKPEEHYIVTVESSPPHVVTVMPLTERALNKGERLCRLWMERLLGCERENYWPGYVDSDAEFSFDAPDTEEIDWEGIEEDE